MTKFIRNPYVPGMGDSQSLISDELAVTWIKNGNTEIRDTPWPGLQVVESYVVVDGPAKVVK